VRTLRSDGYGHQPPPRSHRKEVGADRLHHGLV
jgi:hypothetical protein